MLRAKASGLFPGSEASSAAGAPVVVHGDNAADTARLAVFANNPLYRADPEREWFTPAETSSRTLALPSTRRGYSPRRIRS